MGSNFTPAEQGRFIRLGIYSMFIGALLMAVGVEVSDGVWGDDLIKLGEHDIGNGAWKIGVPVAIVGALFALFGAKGVWDTSRGH